MWPTRTGKEATKSNIVMVGECSADVGQVRLTGDEETGCGEKRGGDRKDDGRTAPEWMREL